MSKLFQILFIALFLFNCSGNLQNKRKISNHKKIEYKAIPRIDQNDNYGIHILLNLPNTLFVFQKSKNHFIANYQISIAILDSSNSQIKHHSWKGIKKVDFFEETRTEAKSISIGHFFPIEPNKYSFSILIEDLDSKYRWNKKIPLRNYSKDFLSPILVSQNKSELKFEGATIPEKTDNINLKVSYHFSNIDIDSLLYITCYNDKKIVLKDSLTINQHSNIINYNMKLSEYWLGELEIQFDYMDISENLKLNLPGNNSRYWKDINTTAKIMTYILSSSEIRELKTLSKKEKILFLKNYWKTIDPTPNTEQNEIMNEFFERVDYVSNNFAEIGPGWQSDRGRTYILFGPPEHIEITNQNNQGYKFEIWHYNSGKQFIFIDEGILGNYRLYREIN
ncbi:MAG: hypothetical protein CMF96_08865 [Candidatus Marinimicrobia bacterium]|nr:hypothetical protein [Candidatus Neomarinimicrobiota bacterium]|tara:strand:- start:5543 stop:6721 length:1179 start_codon:yes stop_codon:yes gene_type:complete